MIFYVSVLDFVFHLLDYVTKQFYQCNGEPSNYNISDEVPFNDSLRICFQFFVKIVAVLSDFTVEK